MSEPRTVIVSPGTTVSVGVGCEAELVTVALVVVRPSTPASTSRAKTTVGTVAFSWAATPIRPAGPQRGRID
jgi:hypothetical protein